MPYLSTDDVRTSAAASLATLFNIVEAFAPASLAELLRPAAGGPGHSVGQRVSKARERLYEAFLPLPDAPTYPALLAAAPGRVIELNGLSRHPVSALAEVTWAVFNLDLGYSGDLVPLRAY